MVVSLRTVLLSLLLLPTLVHAQSPGAPPQGNLIERERPPVPTPTAPGLRLSAPAPPAAFAPGQSGRIGSVSINGATAYPPAELAPLIEGLTGPAVPYARVEQARQAILARYRNDGYVLTSVSSALSANGSLMFNITEGYIADVKLDGDIGPAGTQVLRFLSRLLDERPISISRLERYLLLASDVPGVTLRSVLRPSPDDPAAVTLVAQVSRRPFEGYLSADNRAFRLTGPEQLLAVGGFNSFSQFGERTELSILHSFNNTQTFGQAATEFFAGGSGVKIRLYGGAGGSNPSGDLRALGYDGRTRVFGGQASYPIIRRRDQTLTAIAAFDAIESDIHTDTGPFVLGRNTPARASFDSLRILRGGADYVLQDLVLGGDRTGVTNIVFRGSKGLNSLGATQSGDPQAGRVGSRTDFLKASAEVSRSQVLFSPYQDAVLELYAMASGQVSNSVLPPAEKFFLGGIRMNRGFYAGEVTGDNAVSTSVELRLNTGFPWEPYGQPLFVKTQFYLFNDWGETWENQQQDPNKRLMSFGGGVRASVTRYVSVQLEGVERLTRQPQGSSASVSRLKATAFYWGLTTRW